jgi:hypothetical protein
MRRNGTFAALNAVEQFGEFSFGFRGGDYRGQSNCYQLDQSETSLTLDLGLWQRVTGRMRRRL